MTREEFVEYWCGDSGIAPEDLKSHGQIALPCDCGWSGCCGWQMTSPLPYQLDSKALKALPQEYQDEIRAMTEEPTVQELLDLADAILNAAAD